MPGDGDRWQRQRTIDKSIDRNETFDPAVQQNLGIFFKEPSIVPVSDGKEEVILLPEVSFNAADDRRTIEIPDLLRDHADHVGALYSEIAGIETGPVIQLKRGPEDSLLRVRRYRKGCRRFVQHRRAGPLSQPNALRHHA